MKQFNFTLVADEDTLWLIRPEIKGPLESAGIKVLAIGDGVCPKFGTPDPDNYKFALSNGFIFATCNRKDYVALDKANVGQRITLVVVNQSMHRHPQHTAEMLIKLITEKKNLYGRISLLSYFSKDVEEQVRKNENLSAKKLEIIKTLPAIVVLLSYFLNPSALASDSNFLASRPSKHPTTSIPSMNQKAQTNTNNPASPKSVGVQCSSCHRFLRSDETRRMRRCWYNLKHGHCK